MNGKVVPIRDPDFKEIREALRVLQKLTEEGRLHGLMIGATLDTGDMRVAVRGCVRRSPVTGVAMASKISAEANRQFNDYLVSRFGHQAGGTVDI